MPLASTVAYQLISPAAFVQRVEPARCRALPAVEPGQLWLVDLQPGCEFSAAERHMFGSANVIVYDRTLADDVAAVLPLGSYAEPAPPAAALPDAALTERCVRFALDGWSVVRVIDAERSTSSRAARLRAISDGLKAGGANPQLPVRVFEDAGSRAYRATDTRLENLDREARRGNRLIIVFGAAAGGKPPSAIAANGLAG